MSDEELLRLLESIRPELVNKAAELATDDSGTGCMQIKGFELSTFLSANRQVIAMISHAICGVTMVIVPNAPVRILQIMGDRAAIVSTVEEFIQEWRELQ